jgi:hypothetical protein
MKVIDLLTISLAAFLTICAGGLAQDAPGLPERMVLVKNGKALCRILVADQPGQEYTPEKWAKKIPGSWLYLAAHDLASCIRKSTDAQVEVLTDPAKVKQAMALDDGHIRIHLGMTPYAKALGLDLPKPHGFVIAFPDRNDIVIAGVPIQGKDYNTMYGVHHLLRRYLGVRWLFPGELGEHVPRTDTFAIPAKDVREVPDFPLRSASGWGKIYTPSHKERWEGVYWDMRTGGTHSVVLKYNHNVGNIIDPDTYRDTHPQFFPILDGKRFVPGPDMKHAKGYVHGWEPCYTAKGIAEEAAKHIVEYFDQHPDRYTYSLGINDSARICECNDCRQGNLPINRQIPENANLGPDDPGFEHRYHSQTYYEWANKVVGKVREKYPDRYFGLLGYSRVSIPPENTKLDNHIVPVLAWDFRYFDDPAARAKSEAHVSKWNQAAGTLGWWDYTFEGSYLIPAFSAHHVADTLKYLHKKGLRFYFDELHPGKYFRNAPQEYMERRLLWDITLDPDDLLGEWAELAVGKQAAPAMLKYFALWEDYWTTQVPKTEWYRERVDGSFVAPFLDRRFCGYMDGLTRDRVAAAGKLLKATVELSGTEKQKRRARFFHDYHVMAAKSYFLPYISYAETRGNKAKPESKRVLHSYDFDGPRRGKNPNYQGWGTWKRDASTAVPSPVKGEGRGGTGCLLFHNADSSAQSGLSFTNNFDMPEPGKTYRFSAWYKVMEKAPCREQVSLNIWLYTEKGLLGAVRGSKGALRFREKQSVETEDMGKWREVSITFAVPKDAWKDVTRLYCFLSAQRAPVGTKFWFDDFSVVELDTGE